MSGKIKPYCWTGIGRPCDSAWLSRNRIDDRHSRQLKDLARGECREGDDTLATDAGFSLLELLVVLAIISITFALSANSMRAAGNPARLQPMMQRMAADLRLARTVSIAKSRAIKISVDAAACTYSIETRGTTSIRPCAIALASGAAGASPAVSNSAEFAFFSDGSSTGGQFTLSDKRAAYTLRIDWLTGAVIVTGSSR